MARQKLGMSLVTSRAASGLDCCACADNPANSSVRKKRLRCIIGRGANVDLAGYTKLWVVRVHGKQCGIASPEKMLSSSVRDKISGTNWRQRAGSLTNEWRRDREQRHPRCGAGGEHR